MIQLVGCAQGDVRMRLDKGLKIFGAQKCIFNFRSVSLSVKYSIMLERMVVPTGMHGTETLGVRTEERRKLVFLEK